MARKPKQQNDDEAGEMPSKDFARTKSLILQDVKPARSKASEHMQEASTAYKAIKKECHVQPGAAKVAFSVYEMEEAKAEDWLRSFVGTFNELRGAEVLKLNTNDLVDMAERDMLATLDDDEDDDFEEADEVELAAQEGRGKPKAKAGTGAAAIEAMKKSAAEASAATH